MPGNMLGPGNRYVNKTQDGPAHSLAEWRLPTDFLPNISTPKPFLGFQPRPSTWLVIQGLPHRFRDHEACPPACRVCKRVCKKMEGLQKGLQKHGAAGLAVWVLVVWVGGATAPGAQLCSMPGDIHAEHACLTEPRQPWAKRYSFSMFLLCSKCPESVSVACNSESRPIDTHR